MGNDLVWTVRNKERFAVLLKWILKWEGGVYTDLPQDAGGPTKWGVIKTRYDQYRKAVGKPLQSVRYIEMDEVTAIYARYYWNVIDGDDLPAPYDLALFNVAVNSGTGRAAQFRDEVEKASPGASPLVLARAVCDRYERFYHAIVNNNPSQSIFLRGWLNRLADCRTQIEEYAALTPATGAVPAAWSLSLGDTALGSAWINTKDNGSAYFPVRKYLNALFPDKYVSEQLKSYEGKLLWEGEAIPAKTVMRTDGANTVAWGKVRDLASWSGLDVDADGQDRVITLTRSSGGAKAEDS